MVSNKKILLIDPKSVRHGPPKSIAESDNFINKEYVRRINEEVDKRCPSNNGGAMSSKYVSNYGLLMLGSLLKQDYENVTYINGDYFGSSEEYLKYLASIISEYDLVSLTSTTPQFNEVRKIAMLLKQIKPDIKIILGGPHSRFYIEREVDDCFDTVAIGHGIDKSKESVDKLLRGEEVPKKTITNYYFDVPKDFSLIPKDFLKDTMLYSYINFGCPNDCKYCVEHKFVDKICFNNLDDKFSEIKELATKHGVTFIHLADSDFLMHRKTVVEYIKFVKREKLNFTFSVNTSPAILIKYINDPILKELVDIGMVEILIGAEHFSKKVLDNLAKYYDIEKFIEALNYAKHVANIPIISLYTLVGLPGEYDEDIRINIDTIKRLKENNLFDFTFPKFFVPYPDSDIYLHPDKYDVTIKNENWEEYQRWQLPRPIAINGMDDQKYVDEILEINSISMEEKKNENDCIASLCKKRKQNPNGSGE